MTITRYGLGREYAGNTGSPAITEQADGAYVRYEDFQRMEAAHKAHNEMLVLRTKKAEAVAAGTLIDEGTNAGGAQANLPNGWMLVPERIPAQLLDLAVTWMGPAMREGGRDLAYCITQVWNLFLKDAPTPPADGSAQQESALTVADYEEVLADHRRLVRELDVLLNGDEGAAKQARLCDIVAQVRRGQRLYEPVGYFQRIDCMHSLTRTYVQMDNSIKHYPDVIPLYSGPQVAESADSVTRNGESFWLLRLKQYMQKASFAEAGDKHSALMCCKEIQRQLDKKETHHFPVSSQQPDPAMVGDALPIMRTAFLVTESLGGLDTKNRQFNMVFKYRSMEVMHAADDEWRAFIEQRVQPASGEDA